LGEYRRPSNYLFEPVRGFIGHSRSVDIKIDAPPFQPAPTDNASFEALTDEEPKPGVTNKVYLRVRNRGPLAAVGDYETALGSVRDRVTQLFSNYGYGNRTVNLPALPQTGTYTITYDPDGAKVGSLTFRLSVQGAAAAQATTQSSSADIGAAPAGGGSHREPSGDGADEPVTSPTPASSPSPQQPQPPPAWVGQFHPPGPDARGGRC
jgi:hypothetical protein